MSLFGGGDDKGTTGYRPATPISRSAFDPYWNRQRTAYAAKTGKAWPGPNPPGQGMPAKTKTKSTTSSVMTRGSEGAPKPGRSQTGQTLNFAGT